jgi:hypothetical protein
MTVVIIICPRKPLMLLLRDAIEFIDALRSRLRILGPFAFPSERIFGRGLVICEGPYELLVIGVGGIHYRRHHGS